MTTANKSLLNRYLDFIERAGNKLPDPFIIFFYLAIGTLLLSGFLSWLELKAIHPVDGSEIAVTNLLNKAGIQKVLTEMVKSFAHFPPFAVVLVCMLGIGVAEKSGLFTSALKKLVTVVPSSLLPATLVFAGVMSNVASDAGYIVLTPLGAVLFAAFGRHPLAGLTAAFAGVSGGFSANLFISTLDPLLGGLSTKAAQLIDPSYEVLPTANYYFMFVSTFVITLAGAWVTVKIVEPRLGPWKGNATAAKDDDLNHELTAIQKLGLRWTLIYTILFAAILCFVTLPENAILKDDQGKLGPFFQSVVPIIMLFFLGSGIVYGKFSQTIKSSKDVVMMFNETMSTMGSYVVLAFIMAQFVSYFSWSNIGIISAIKGAAFLKSVGLSGATLFILFILFTAFMNLFMGSASAKWALFAPVFVPMFMMMGYTPEVVQTSYRIGDSVSNIISPLLPYFPIIVAFARRYQADLGVGTLISLMIPFSIVFLIAWGIMFVVWYLMGWPLGPNVEMLYILKGN